MAVPTDIPTNSVGGFPFLLHVEAFNTLKIMQSIVERCLPDQKENNRKHSAGGSEWSVCTGGSLHSKSAGATGNTGCFQWTKMSAMRTRQVGESGEWWDQWGNGPSAGGCWGYLQVPRDWGGAEKRCIFLSREFEVWASSEAQGSLKNPCMIPMRELSLKPGQARRALMLAMGRRWGGQGPPCPLTSPPYPSSSAWVGGYLN